ncbi:hypothetical protein AYI68_g5607 [Smittium mucronatum]|uniref:Transposon TX1 protein n=1 Tax=Smittium mucronatum TaxID=133383 RepID=A0A1R0GTU7_9FUNG|nr:hypothetical protein AYI68_g5607 [Smittium mucronatum]
MELISENLSVANGPIYDKYKKLVIETTEKINIWNNHIKELAKDSNGNSRNPEKWESIAPIECDYFPDCDESVSWGDIITGLRDTPNNKAPGIDGVPSEIWKLVMKEKAPTSNLAKLLHKIICKIYY